MEGVNNAFYCLDYSPEEFEKGFGPWIEKQYEFILQILLYCIA